MGYETKLYIGNVVDLDNGLHKRVQVVGPFEGQTRGSVFQVYDEGDDAHFYLADGDTRISLKCAEQNVNLKILPEARLKYFMVMGMVDMSKMGVVQNHLTPEDIIAQDPIFTPEEMTIVEDRYGSKLVVHDAKAVLRALQHMAAEDGGHYWRFKLAIVFLENVVENAWQPNLGVICYGY